MDIVFSKDSFYISGKPADVLEALFFLSKTYGTLGELLASLNPDTGKCLRDELSRKNSCCTGSKEKFRIFLDSPPHYSNINLIPLKPFDSGYPRSRRQ